VVRLKYRVVTIVLGGVRHFLGFCLALLAPAGHYCFVDSFLVVGRWNMIFPDDLTWENAQKLFTVYLWAVVGGKIRALSSVL